MATTFQYLFDNAESISIDTQVNTAQSISRDNTVTSLERGGQTWRFTVKMPDGISYEEWRPQLAAIDYAGKSGRFGSEYVYLNNSGYTDWFTQYRGDVSTGLTGWSADLIDAFTLDNINIGATPPSGTTILRAGDLIKIKSVDTVTQTGDFNAYRIVSDLPVTPGAGCDVAKLHRPANEYSSPSPVVTFDVGPANVFWKVEMVQYPQWNIFARNQVSWNGPFVFYETVKLVP